MDPWQDIERSIRLASVAPFTIESRAGAGGGCINECHVIRGQGRAFFVKLNAPEKAEMFSAEAAGLREIARTKTIRVPEPICHGASPAACWLVLEHLELRRGDDRSMAQLGRNLARMHRVTSKRFGWHRDNTIGATPQVNTRSGDWIAFWHECRLGYQLKLADSGGHSRRLVADGERLLGALPSFFHGYTPPPSLLHGDLWSGNVGLETGGDPVIYDPAVYYGDREADLAMTELVRRLSGVLLRSLRRGISARCGIRDAQAPLQPLSRVEPPEPLRWWLRREGGTDDRAAAGAGLTSHRQGQQEEDNRTAKTPSTPRNTRMEPQINADVRRFTTTKQTACVMRCFFPAHLFRFSWRSWRFNFVLAFPLRPSSPPPLSQAERGDSSLPFSTREKGKG